MPSSTENGLTKPGGRTYTRRVVLTSGDTNGMRKEFIICKNSTDDAAKKIDGLKLKDGRQSPVARSSRPPICKQPCGTPGMLAWAEDNRQEQTKNLKYPRPTTKDKVVQLQNKKFQIKVNSVHPAVVNTTPTKVTDVRSPINRFPLRSAIKKNTPVFDMTPGPRFSKNKTKNSTKAAEEDGGTSSVEKSPNPSKSSDVNVAELERFAEECLKWHNNYRKHHHVPPLTLSRKLSEYAYEWAKGLAKTEILKHRPNNPYGENLFMSYSSDPDKVITGKEPVDSWYREIKDYKSFGSEPTVFNKIGHFTQLVWNDSKELGIGMVKNKAGKVYVVANYSPKGNFVGSFNTNVTKPDNLETYLNETSK